MPASVFGYNAQWTGQWTTTVPGQMSVYCCAKNMPSTKL
ncbi:mannan-binding protein [Massilia horti]|uniref:Mannan-binding protein domain-containing protein n=1 Tax=Massilia horti TaxID=2562153 RepID=A0A4Y9SUQ2_9BURK|nr:hypothetical protein E4O92_20150 [Massilia horti]